MDAITSGLEHDISDISVGEARETMENNHVGQPLPATHQLAFARLQSYPRLQG